MIIWDEELVAWLTVTGCEDPYANADWSSLAGSAIRKNTALCSMNERSYRTSTCASPFSATFIESDFMENACAGITTNARIQSPVMMKSLFFMVMGHWEILFKKLLDDLSDNNPLS